MNLFNIDAKQEDFLVKYATIVFDTSSIGQLYCREDGFCESRSDYYAYCMD